MPCTAAKLLTPDEARRIAANIAKLPELFGKAKRHNNLPADVQHRPWLSAGAATSTVGGTDARTVVG